MRYCILYIVVYVCIYIYIIQYINVHNHTYTSLAKLFPLGSPFPTCAHPLLPPTSWRAALARGASAMAQRLTTGTPTVHQGFRKRGMGWDGIMIWVYLKIVYLYIQWIIIFSIKKHPFGRIFHFQFRHTHMKGMGLYRIMELF